MLKKYLSVFVVGILGGIFAFSVMRHSLKSIVTAPSVSAVPLPTEFLGRLRSSPGVGDAPLREKHGQETTPSADFWQNIVANESFSVVAIQSFTGSVLLKQSSGMVLSADGLIITTADAVISGGYYQVLADDKILKASMLAWDYGKNLAIFKVSAQDLNVANLDDLSSPGSGQELVITGKFVSLSKPVVFSQRALINYVLDRDVILDTGYNVFLNGAKVVDKNSRMIGMAYARSGKIHLIKSQIIYDFLKAQLSKKESKKEGTN